MTIGEKAREFFLNMPGEEAVKKVDELVVEVKNEMYRRGDHYGGLHILLNHEADILAAYETGTTHGYRECLLPECSLCKANKQRRAERESKESRK